MSEFAQVVELNAVRVVDERPVPPAIPLMRTATGWSERLGPSPALFWKLHKSGKLTGYRLMSNPDPRRCPLLFAEEDVMFICFKTRWYR